jgi:hypothetical protein
VRFDGDPEKARRNLAKHGVTFDVAQNVWDDPLHVILAVLVVVHVYPDAEHESRVRIIGARKATVQERRRYEQEGA